MADTFFGFGTLLSNINDDEGGGGPSEDEYDALNDETFGNVGDDHDWEEEHEQLAELTEKSRRHKDEDLDLEASLSQLVLEDSDQIVSGIREALSWSMAEMVPSSSRADMAPNLLNGQPYSAVGTLPMKSVCTVEELERSLRGQHRPQGAGESEQGGASLDQMMEILQQSGVGSGQSKQQTSFFQPRFPPVILQRPPGLQAPVPLPFAPQAQHLISQQQQQKQQTQHQLLNQQQQMNQQQINQLNQQQAQQQHKLMNQQQPQQMQQQLNQQSHNQLNQIMNPPQQQTQQQQMNQLNQQQLNQLNQQPQMNQMNQQQQQQQLNQFNQQLGQQSHQLMNQQQMMGGMMHPGPQMMMGPRMMGPPPLGIGGAPRQQFLPGIGGPGGPGGPFGPQQGSGPFQPFGMPLNMPPQQVMHGTHQPQSLQSIEQNMVGQQKQQQQQQMQNQQKPQQQMGPMMNQQQQPQMQMNHQSQLMHQQQQQPQLQLNHQQQPNQQKSQLNDGGKINRAMNSMNVYPNKQNLSSQNLVQMIQNTHPMLQNNHAHFNSGYHNASHHPVLNRGGYFNGGNGNNGLFHNGSLIFQNQNQGQQMRNNGDYGVGGDGRIVNGQVERWKGLEGLNGGMAKEGGDPEDEYAGLMSNREKQWLINIQMLQLNTGTPYIDDFYYTVFLDRQTKKEKEGVKEAHKANQQNHPFYSSGKPEGPVHRDRHNSGRHNSTGDESGQAPRTYVPTQFENSLGKLQCGSVTAPRKIIDVELVQSTEGSTSTTTTSSASSSTAVSGRERRALSDGAASASAASSGLAGIGDGVKLTSDQVPREVRRTKQLLLDIEALYCILLRLEEMNDPLAIANAVILKEREEKQKQAEQAHQPPSEESGARIGLPATSASGTVSAAAPRNLLDENRDELTAKLMAGLLHEDRLTAFMGVRKGKTLIQRVLARVPPSHARLRETWPRILRGLAAHARRDSRDDRLLATFHGAFRRYVQQSSGWHPLLELCTALEEGFREGAIGGNRPASRATPTQHRCPLHLALATPLTLNCISTMFVKADELVRTSESGEQGATFWSSFVQGLARSLRSAPTASPPVQPLPSAFLTAHLAALAEVSGREEVVARSEVVADVLVRYLC